MEIVTMILDDLEQMKDTLYSDFDNFWSYNILKQELENKNTTYIVAKENNEVVGFAGISTCLDEATLKMILTEPKNAVLKQYKCLLEMDGVELEFEPEAIDLIAQEAIKRKTGARALRSIVEEIMLDVMYDVPTKNDMAKFTVTADMVRNRKNAQVVPLPTTVKDKEITA